MSNKSESTSKVYIGQARDISGPVAGKNATQTVTTITIGGQPIRTDETPTLDQFRQALAEIQQELLAVIVQQERLKAISAATPFMLTGAEASLKDAVEHVQPDVEPKEVQSLQKSLTEAKGLLNNVLNGARTAAEESEELQPLTEQLEPLVEKTDVLEQWAAKLWMTK